MLYFLCALSSEPLRDCLCLCSVGRATASWPSIWWNQLKLFIHTQGEPQHRLLLLRKKWPWVEGAIFWEQSLACLPEGAGEISASCTCLLFSICHFCAVCLLKKKGRRQKKTTRLHPNVKRSAIFNLLLAVKQSSNQRIMQHVAQCLISQAKLTLIMANMFYLHRFGQAGCLVFIK